MIYRPGSARGRAITYGDLTSSMIRYILSWFCNAVGRRLINRYESTCGLLTLAFGRYGEGVHSDMNPSSSIRPIFPLWYNAIWRRLLDRIILAWDRVVDVGWGML